MQQNRKEKTVKHLSQINNQIVQSLFNSLANSVPNSVVNSVVSFYFHKGAVQPFILYANEMNILRAFLCRYFFRIIDSHECLRENIIMIQICSPMRKFGQHCFLKKLTTSLSGATHPLKDCGSLPRFHQN